MRTCVFLPTSCKQYLKETEITEFSNTGEKVEVSPTVISMMPNYCS